MPLPFTHSPFIECRGDKPHMQTSDRRPCVSFYATSMGIVSYKEYTFEEGMDIVIISSRNIDLSRWNQSDGFKGQTVTKPLKMFLLALKYQIIIHTSDNMFLLHLRGMKNCTHEKASFLPLVSKGEE